jgi:hypothetical protein
MATAKPPTRREADWSRLEEQCKSGARWFYWVAALSFVTSVISLAGGKWGFAIGFGVTRFIDIWAAAAATRVGWPARAVGFALGISILGAVALVGYFAARRMATVFVVGISAYALDAMLFVYVRDWLGLAFHVVALYGMFSGFRACLKLRTAGEVAAPAVPFGGERAEAPATP